MVATVIAFVSAQSEQPRKIPIMLMVGCLEQDANQAWLVTSATDPMETVTKGSPPLADTEAAKLSGANRYRLIGVSEFNLPAHKGHKERVEGLVIAAKPMNRLNVTSVRHLADVCTK